MLDSGGQQLHGHCNISAHLQSGKGTRSFFSGPVSLGALSKRQQNTSDLRESTCLRHPSTAKGNTHPQNQVYWLTASRKDCNHGRSQAACAPVSRQLLSIVQDEQDVRDVPEDRGGVFEVSERLVSGRVRCYWWLGVLLGSWGHGDGPRRKRPSALHKRASSHPFPSQPLWVSRGLFPCKEPAATRFLQPSPVPVPCAFCGCLCKRAWAPTSQVSWSLAAAC